MRLDFDSISSFTGLFKRIVGQTPSAYQQECRRKRKKSKQCP